MKQKEQYVLIPIGKIDPSPYGIRKGPNSPVGSLTGSVERFGVLTPIRVRPKPNERYEVIYGDRRLNAARAAGHRQIECIVEKVSDQDALLMHIVENVARRDFNPIEEAEGYLRLRKLGFQTKAIARLVGKAEGTVSNRLALLDLPKKIQAYIGTGKLKVQLGLLISHQIPPKYQEHVANTIVESNYEYFQALSYVESLIERFKLETYHQALEDMKQKSNPKSNQEETRKQGEEGPEPEWVRKRHEEIEAKLQGAFAVDRVNLGFLRIWRLAQRIEPKLRAYERILCDRTEVIEALKQDLTQLELKKLEKGTSQAPGVTA